MNQINDPSAENVSKTLIKLECDALERWGKGDPSGFLEICAPDVVYFDPGLDMRIDGLEALTSYYEGIRGQVFFERFKLLNPVVQCIGDAAVLTFNYISYGTDGEPHPWNCTEIYRRSQNKWLIIQTHWSYTRSIRA